MDNQEKYEMEEEWIHQRYPKCPYCGADKRTEREFECGSLIYDGEVMKYCEAGKVVFAPSSFFDNLVPSPERSPCDETWVGPWSSPLDPHYDNPFNRRRNDIDGSQEDE
jgi:hypothetical protein